jgi:tetratricopeptide (TPR) repeat protein
MQAELTPLVRSLATAIKEYDAENPDVLSYELLGFDTDQADPFSDRAAKRWLKVLKEKPDDPWAAHHLAVICHGRAYKLHENEETQLEAVRFWRQGLEMWHRVLVRDEFWDRLRANWEERLASGTEKLLAEGLLKVDLQSLRRQLPHFLLEVHLSILKSTFPKRMDLAREHLKIVNEAPFGEECRERVRKSVYGSLAGNSVNPLLGDLKTAEALDLVTQYLELDPDHPRALADGLKAITKHADRIKADGSDDADTFVRQKACFKRGQQWADRLEKHLDNHDDLFLADALRTYFADFALMLTNRGIGMANSGDKYGGLDVILEAGSLYRRAVLREKGGNEARSRYVHCCNQMCIVATACESKLSQTYEFVQAAEKLLPNQPLLLARLAYLSALRGNRSEFERWFREAERYQEANPDFQAAEVIAQLRQRGMGIGAERFFSEAMAALEVKNTSRALSLLREADSKDPGNPLVKIVMVPCHLDAGDLHAAWRACQDADRAERKRPGPEARQLIDQYLQQFKQVRHLL